MKTFVWYLIVAVIGGASLVCLGVIAANLHPFVDLMGQFLLPAMPAALVATLAAAAFRFFRTAGAGLAVTLLSFGLAWPWTATPDEAPEGANRFTVLLFNTWFSNATPESVRKLIEDKNPDVVVLLETTKRMRDALRPLDIGYPYRVECWASDGCDSLILSRAPLSEPHAQMNWDDGLYVPLNWVEMSIANCRINLFATHMTRPYPMGPWGMHPAQAKALGDGIALWPGPKLFVGDLNAASWGAIAGEISHRARLHILTGGGGSWPSILPPQLRIPIDNMMASDGLQFTKREVGPGAGSDHMPILAEIAVVDSTICR